MWHMMLSGIDNIDILLSRMQIFVSLIVLFCKCWWRCTMKFLDEAKIFIKAGDGGDGCSSFRREKFIEFGGPDGGNGGAGGNIYALAVPNINTLIDYRYQQHFKVKKGMNGSGQNRTGKSSDDIILKVPVGTQILDSDKEVEIADLVSDGDTVLLAKGGKGGLGNINFKSSRIHAPIKATKGEVGEEKWIWLKLKLIADIGLVGKPNAGKSTFINSVTNANAKIGNYEFTTLNPQLGVVKAYAGKEVVIADIPGLIDGAHYGKGLGHKFLAHVERCSIIIHIVDATADNAIDNYLTIRNELKQYNLDLYNKTEIIALNKVDEECDVEGMKSSLSMYTNNKIFAISALTKANCLELVQYASTFCKYANKQ